MDISREHLCICVTSFPNWSSQLRQTVISMSPKAEGLYVTEKNRALFEV